MHWKKLDSLLNLCVCVCVCKQTERSIKSVFLLPHAETVMTDVMNMHDSLAYKWAVDVCLCLSSLCEINNVLLGINIIHKRQAASDWLSGVSLIWLISGTVGCRSVSFRVSGRSGCAVCDVWFALVIITCRCDHVTWAALGKNKCT